MSRKLIIAFGAVLLTSVAVPITTASAHTATRRDPVVRVLNNSALDGLGSGSTIGPDGALYVTNGTAGTLVRIDVRTGRARVVGRGLPKKVIEIGGPMDVSFIGKQAFVMVSIAGVDVGGPDVAMGIYRLERDGTFSLFADIGAWSAAHPPVDPDWFLAEGVQYSMDVWRDGFLLTDAHHARVLRIDSRGNISALVAFDDTDVVPLGLETSHGKVYLTTAGPIPHLPSTAKIDLVGNDGSVTAVGGWPTSYLGDRGLPVDVEVGDDGRLFGLLQGHWDRAPIDENEGTPAAPNTGEIVEVDRHGDFRALVDGLDQPTSMEVVDHVAYVVTLTGTILKVTGI